MGNALSSEEKKILGEIRLIRVEESTNKELTAIVSCFDAEIKVPCPEYFRKEYDRVRRLDRYGQEKREVTWRRIGSNSYSSWVQDVTDTELPTSEAMRLYSSLIEILREYKKGKNLARLIKQYKIRKSKK